MKFKIYFMKKSFVLIAISAIAVIGGIYSVNTDKQEIFTILANVEALADKTPENQDFNCYIHKDHCVVSAGTDSELGSLNKLLRKLGKLEVKMNVSVDLTDATCIYSTDVNGPKVRCGQDKRCADIWSK